MLFSSISGAPLRPAELFKLHDLVWIPTRAPGTDRYGIVTKLGLRLVSVRLERSGRVVNFTVHTVRRVSC
jgi:hypothetical protein